MTTQVPPYCTPDQCDHEGAPDGFCSHCCPCATCAELRQVEETSKMSTDDGTRETEPCWKCGANYTETDCEHMTLGTRVEWYCPTCGAFAGATDVLPEHIARQLPGGQDE